MPAPKTKKKPKDILLRMHLKHRIYISLGIALFAFLLVFQSSLAAPLVKAALELQLAAYAGKPVGVAIRTPQQLAEVLANNPFAHAPPNRTVAIFLDQPPGASALQGIAGQAGEEIAVGRCEIYVLYGASMAQSKLRIPAAKAGTARNMNTLLKLCNMANAAVTAAVGPKRR